MTNIVRRSGLNYLTRRPVATLVICVAFILVLQLVLLLSWDVGGQPKPISSSIGLSKLGQKLPLARKEGGRILGLNPALSNRYEMDEEGMFACLITKEIIQYSMVNDDYCDCKDGSDEPSTSACPGTFFFCSSSSSSTIPSSRVNDGVCDCCDGSDEYQNVRNPLLARPARDRQEVIGKFLTPCPDTCSILG